MSRRWSLALGLSVLVHLALIGAGLGLGVHRFTGPVDIEITGLKIDEVKDLPLGGPAAGHGAAHTARRAHHHAPPAEGTLAAKPDARERPGQAKGAEEDQGPAPTSDLTAYGPKGSRLTVLVRLDRLRGTDYVPAVDALLARLPDRRDLLEGTDLDLFQSFDALLIATPHPLDPTVTFLAARHHLDDGQLRAALTRGAKATDRVLVWRTEGGRPVGERHPRRGLPPGTWSRDDRLIVLPAPGLAIVTPPAYRALLMAPHPAAAPADGGAPDAGASDGGAPAGIDWATMLGRINAEEGLMPEDGAVMVSAVDIFKSNGQGGVPPLLYGMEVPGAASAVLGLDDEGTFLDLDGRFPTEGPARHWEEQWPVIRQKLAGNPLVLLGGFSPLIAHATLTRDGPAIHLHVAATHEETQRLLAVALHLLGGG
ncbi:MAG TPA: hypothetical protein VHO06_02240 [Polyangia bacterium]|nr:hypothetical protein [Polyangia bacterium]